MVHTNKSYIINLTLLNQIIKVMETTHRSTTIHTPKPVSIVIRISQKIIINSFGKQCRHLIGRVEKVLCEFSISFCVVFACGLHNASSIRIWHQFVLITHLLQWLCQKIPFNYCVLIHIVFFIHHIHLLLHIP